MRSEYPIELASEVGYVVLEAAAAEDTSGEILGLLAGDQQFPYQWSRSGTQLIERMRSETRLTETCKGAVETLGTLHDLRNRVVHGVWVHDGNQWFTLRRTLKSAKSDEPPTYEASGWIREGLLNLAEGFREVRAVLDAEVSLIMGVHGTERDLPTGP